MNLGISGSIGKNYSNTTIIPTYNGVYTAEVTVGTEKTTETLVVRSLYAQDAFNDYYTEKWFNDNSYDYWKNGMPPFISTDEQLFQFMNQQFQTNISSRNDLIKYTKDYFNPTNWTDSQDNEIYATKVNTNGGFYVARFEAGSSSTRTSGDASTAVSTMTAPLSQIGVDTYNFVTRDQAIGLAEKMYSGKSYLITNAAWDRTLGWIINNNDKSLTISNIVADSKSWGNYSDSSFNYAGTGSLAKTGAFESNTKVNNIYDLAGNVYEWTSAISTNSSDPCVSRGGYCLYTGSNSPASYRNFINTSVYGYNFGFRVVLFL